MVIMMKFLYILWAIESIFHFGNQYRVSDVICQDDKMIMTVDQYSYPFELFNINLTEEGRQQACLWMEQSDHLTMEIDEYVTMDSPILVWMFIDGENLQEKLIKEGLASYNVANPLFKYNEICVNATKQESVFAAKTSNYAKTMTNRGYKLCLTLVLIVIAFITAIGLLKRKRSEKG